MQGTDVQIQIPGRKPNFLASAKVTISDGQSTITITDLRVLANKQNQLWVAFPNLAVPNGRDWKYEPLITFSRSLAFQISEAVLGEYEKQAPAAQKQ